MSCLKSRVELNLKVAREYQDEIQDNYLKLLGLAAEKAGLPAGLQLEVDHEHNAAAWRLVLRAW
jgi:hypothetical protein